MAKLSPGLGQPDIITRKAKQEWQRLCDSYLPVRDRASIWRFSRNRRCGDPTQGWKLHVSATILSACEIFRVVAPYLKQRGIMFKAPRSLAELHKLNAGIFYGFGQVGKFITIYPPTPEVAQAIAPKLHRLTAKYRGPVIPYDNRLRSNSCVYYRYGAFLKRTMVFRGRRVEALVRPDGKRVPDLRKPKSAVPLWLSDPFGPPPVRRGSLTPLETDYRDYEALTQRGRGGIYRALDISSRRARPCILKEGRRHGETDVLGRDGFYLVKQEARFLKSNADKVSGLPRVIATFCADDCFYLVMEHIAGRSLHQVLASPERISLHRLLTYCANMSRVVAEIHAAGWAWHDCKPANFLCQSGGNLRPIDFDGACPLRMLDLWPVGTEGYIEVTSRKRPPLPEQADLHALGVSLAQVTTRTAAVSKIAATFSRKAKEQRLPGPLIETIQSLLESQPRSRPSARTVHGVLKELLATPLLAIQCRKRRRKA